MKIKTVEYSALINLGNYSNEKIGFTAELAEEETVEQVIESLRQKVRENGGPNADEMYNKLYESRQALKELERKIQKAAQQWNATAEFLRAQGIKPDAVDLPQFTHLLPEVKEEHTRVDGEILDDTEGVF
jgi:phosphotransacetylase